MHIVVPSLRLFLVCVSLIFVLPSATSFAFDYEYTRPLDDLFRPYNPFNDRLGQFKKHKAVIPFGIRPEEHTKEGIPVFHSFQKDLVTINIRQYINEQAPKVPGEI